MADILKGFITHVKAKRMDVAARELLAHADARIASKDAEIASLSSRIASLEGRLKASISLTPAEMQSGLSRVRWAEGLIRQLPENHDGRNSWLINYAAQKSDAEPRTTSATAVVSSSVEG